MKLVSILSFVVGLAACGPGSSGGPCTGAETKCTEDGEYLVCNNGEFKRDTKCEFGCTKDIGCTTCNAGEATCAEGGISRVCKLDGSGWEEEACVSELGLTCGEQTGRCEGPCSRQALGSSYIGCEYFATQTGNLVVSSIAEDNTEFLFAVVLSNTSNVEADITITGGSLGAPRTFTLKPNEVRAEYLPRVDPLSFCRDASCSSFSFEDSHHVVDGAYQIRSTHPITAFQFNPLDYTKNGNFSYSNDASLLLPTNAMGDSFVVSTWDATREAPDGFGGWTTLSTPSPPIIAITATEDNTTFTVNAKAAFYAGNGAPPIPAGGSQSFTIDKGDVLQLVSPDDPSGTRIDSDKRINVLASHFCAYVPARVEACDHLEETQIPLATLSARYISTPPEVPNDTSRIRIIRVTSTESNTTLTWDPPIAGAPTEIVPDGGVIQVETNQAVAITGSARIIVTEFMRGQDSANASDFGDPSMTLTVPTEQYRTDYQFLAPTNYDRNFINITKPKGSTITVDGQTVTGFSAIGNTDYEYKRYELDNSGNGVHTAKGDQRFGVTVYGYGQWTSYWYPGGLDLETIPVE